MRTLQTSEAATLLNVEPNPLRACERRFDYPKPQRSAGRHRLYTHGRVAALRQGLSASGQLPTALLRRTHHAANVRGTARARVLPDTPLGAQRQLLALVDDRRDAREDAAAQPLRDAARLALREAQA
jgi:DNA-binding transcriptional MerR regulator